MRHFLSDNRDELIARCKEKVARRPLRAATAQQLDHGIPVFLAQLTSTLTAEEGGNTAESRRISGAAGGDAAALSQIGSSAAAHGKELMKLGYSLDQVVHDYGDLCQSITDLAVERQAPFAIDHFRTLNRCLDNAIADAVTEFSAQRDAAVSRQRRTDENERLGVLAHELRNFLQTATMAFAVLESGTVAIGGSTGALVKRSLVGLSDLLDSTVRDVRTTAEAPDAAHVFSLAAWVADAKSIATLGATARGCSFVVPEVDRSIGIAGNRDHLLAALVNLLQNAFKFTRESTQVRLRAYAEGDRVLIDVEDHCDGIPPEFADRMFKPFTQGSADRSGVGLGLFIARRTVEADGGSLTVRNLPGTGCVFTLSLPRHALS